MEFSSVWYFSFCSVVSLLFLMTGMHALDKAALPVPYVVMLLFKILIPFSLATWSSCAYLFRPLLEHAELNQGHKSKEFYLTLSHACQAAFLLFVCPSEASNLYLLQIIEDSIRYSLSSFLTISTIVIHFYDSKAVGSFLTGFFGPFMIYPNHTLCWILFNNLHFFVGYANFLPGEIPFFFQFTYYWHFSIYFLYMYRTFHPPFKNKLVVSDFMTYVYRKRKAIESIVGLSGILIAQCFPIENSGALVFALACFCVSWLANLAVNQPATDLGIFNFLISACVQCTVKVFGFHVYTWLVFGFGVLLIIIRWNIDSISLRYTGMQEAALRKWENLEQLRDSRYQISPERATETPADNIC